MKPHEQNEPYQRLKISVCDRCSLVWLYCHIIVLISNAIKKHFSCRVIIPLMMRNIHGKIMLIKFLTSLSFIVPNEKSGILRIDLIKRKRENQTLDCETVFCLNQIKKKHLIEVFNKSHCTYSILDCCHHQSLSTISHLCCTALISLLIFPFSVPVSSS